MDPEDQPFVIISEPRGILRKGRDWSSPELTRERWRGRSKLHEDGTAETSDEPSWSSKNRVWSSKTQILSSRTQGWSSENQDWSFKNKGWSLKDKDWSPKDQSWSPRDQDWSPRGQDWSHRDQNWSFRDPPSWSHRDQYWTPRGQDWSSRDQDVSRNSRIIKGRGLAGSPLGRSKDPRIEKWRKWSSVDHDHKILSDGELETVVSEHRTVSSSEIRRRWEGRGSGHQNDGGRRSGPGDERDEEDKEEEEEEEEERRRSRKLTHVVSPGWGFGNNKVTFIRI